MTKIRLGSEDRAIKIGRRSFAGPKAENAPLSSNEKNFCYRRFPVLSIPCPQKPSFSCTELAEHFEMRLKERCFEENPEVKYYVTCTSVRNGTKIQ